jgi:hypothetical protein
MATRVTTCSADPTGKQGIKERRGGFQKESVGRAERYDRRRDYLIGRGHPTHGQDKQVFQMTSSLVV